MLLTEGFEEGGRTTSRGETLFDALFIDGKVRQMVDWLRDFVDINGPVIKAAELDLEEIDWAKKAN